MIYQLIYTQCNKDYSESLYSYGVFDSVERANAAKNDCIATYTQYSDGIEKEREIANLNRCLKIVPFELNKLGISRL